MYLRLSTISKDEEVHAAEGVADIAMGLTYAQLHEADPASQNWSDPEFLASQPVGNFISRLHIDWQHDELFTDKSHPLYFENLYELRSVPFYYRGTTHAQLITNVGP